ncbi:helix-turn-helix transcriptional regulator [Fictibacillus iocasae]|uniref:Helix-turn-helix transcriptional regulator n=1 Tax=Fictibacillus iocasae TaxID=2715437 RepID=A0ABW2NUU4_9BACL
MAKIKRLELLLLSINSKQHFTLKELAEEFQVSTRTIQRDLIQLTEMGLPIVSEFGPNGGYRLENDRILPPVGLTEMEALALLHAADPHLHDSSPWKNPARSAYRKLLEFLPQDAKELLLQRQDRVMFQTPLPVHSDFVDLVIEASVKQKVISLTTKDGMSNIQPIGIFSLNGSWYCPAYCFTKEDFTILSLKTIQAASIIQDVSGPKNFQNVTILNWVHTIASPSQTFLHVHLTLEGAYSVSLHPVLSQLLTIHPDGTGEIKGTVLNECLPLISDCITGLKDDATLLSPVYLSNEGQTVQIGGLESAKASVL